MAIKKGQNLRLFIDTKCIGMSKSCTWHVAAQTEDSSTKDSTGDWAESEVVGLSWDCSADALVFDTDNASEGYSTLLAAMIAKTKVTVKFATTSGAQNRTEGMAIKTGEAYITDFSLNAANRQDATYTVQFTGTGALN